MSSDTLQLAFGSNQSSLDAAAALQCLCRAWAGVRSWKCPTPHPSLYQVEVMLHLRGLRPSAVSNHLIVPWSLMTQFQDPSAVIRFREDTAVRYLSPGQVSCHTFGQLQKCAGSCGEEETSKLPLQLSWSRCIKQKTNNDSVGYIEGPPWDLGL